MPFVFRRRERRIRLEELVLLALALLGGEANATRIQKAAFVLARELEDRGFVVPKIFQAHYYGPYSREVEEVLEELRDMGKIEEERKHWNGYQKIYKLTVMPRIVEKYKVLLGEDWDRISEKIRSISEKDLDAILERIYNEYPDYAAKSRVAIPAKRRSSISMKVMDPSNPEDAALLEKEYYSDEGFKVIDHGVIELEPGETKEIAPGIRVRIDEKNPDHVILEFYDET